MKIHLVLEQEYGKPTIILECYDEDWKAKEHIKQLIENPNVDPYTGYSVKSLEIKREVKIPKLT